MNMIWYTRFTSRYLFPLLSWSPRSLPAQTKELAIRLSSVFWACISISASSPRLHPASVPDVSVGVFASRKLQPLRLRRGHWKQRHPCRWRSCRASGTSVHAVSGCFKQGIAGFCPRPARIYARFPSACERLITICERLISTYERLVNTCGDCSGTGEGRTGTRGPLGSLQQRGETIKAINTVNNPVDGRPVWICG